MVVFSGVNVNSMLARKDELNIGVCEQFPCDLFVDQFDPTHGRKNAFTRAGLLAYRKRVGTQKFIGISKKLEEERK